MSALDRHPDPVVALTGGRGENAPIRWYRDKAAVPVAAGHMVRAAAFINGVNWHSRDGSWAVAGERSAVA